jgi:hypothetical protein
MAEPNENEGLDLDLDFDITKVNVDPKGVVPKTELEPENETIVEPIEPVEPKRGRPKKVEKVVETVVEPEPIVPEIVEGDEVIEPTLISSLAAKMGFELGEDDVFEETEEGLVEFIKSTGDKLADSKLNGYFESLPPIAGDFFDFLQMLGDEATEEKIQAFFSSVKPEIDYKSVDLNNEDAQKAVMRTFYKKMEYNDAEITEAIEDLEIAGTLAKSAKVASTKLAARQESERAALLEKTRAEDLAKKEKIQKYWGAVDTTIKNGKVGNFNIPVTEQKAILEYMSKPTKSGVPQFQEELNNMSVEDRIQLAIAVKNKFNLSKYINTAVKTAQASTLRERLATGTTKLKGAPVVGSGSEEIVFEIK